MSDFRLITTSDELEQFCQQAQQQPILCIDTEFVRTRTLFPEAGLFQANDGISSVIIDPIAIDDLSPFWALLTNPSIIKAIHSCSEDIELIKQESNDVPVNLIDTQIAAGMLGHGSSLGYGAMVEKYLGINLDKGEARTNWLKRPLSAKQMQYAANDVVYLMPVFEHLYAELQEQNLVDIVLNETAMVVEKRSQMPELMSAWKSFKNLSKLTRHELAILVYLGAWRLKEARRRNLALNFIVREEPLLDIARIRPTDINQLYSIRDLPPQVIKRYGKKLIECVENGLNMPEKDQPDTIKRLIEFPGYKDYFSALKKTVTQAASANDIPAEMIASKRQLNQVLSWYWQKPEQSGNTPDLLQGWRETLVGEKIREIMKAR